MIESAPETIFTITAIIFTIALIPPIIQGVTWSGGSSFMTAAALTANTWAFALLGMTYSTLTSAMTCAAWWFIYAFRQEPKKSTTLRFQGHDPKS